MDGVKFRDGKLAAGQFTALVVSPELVDLRIALPRVVHVRHRPESSEWRGELVQLQNVPGVSKVDLNYSLCHPHISIHRLFHGRGQTHLLFIHAPRPRKDVINR